jgi:hypothetical protein
MENSEGQTYSTSNLPHASQENYQSSRQNLGEAYLAKEKGANF